MRFRGLLRQGILADERYRRAALTFGVSTLSAGLTFVVNIVTVPAVLHAVGAARFALWMTLYSFIPMLAAFDLGVGLSLVTLLARMDMQREPRRLVSSAAAITLAFCGLVLATMAVLYTRCDWARVLGVADALRNETNVSVAVLAICFVVSLPLLLAARIQAAQQRGYVANSWDVVARCLILAGVLFVAHSHPSIPALVAVVAGAPVITGLANSTVLFGRHPNFRPSRRSVDAGTVRLLLSSGGAFLVLQVVQALVYNSDLVIISRNLTPEDVATYAVPRTLFQMTANLTLLLLTPLWPAYSEAFSKKEFDWIRRTLLTSTLAVAALTLAASAILFCFGDRILSAWVGRPFHVPPLLLAGFGAWIVLSTVGSAFAMVLNGAGVMRFQVLTALAMGTAAVVAKVVGASHFGVAGVIWGTVAAYFLFSLAPSFLFIRRWLNAAILG